MSRRSHALRTDRRRTTTLRLERLEPRLVLAPVALVTSTTPMRALVPTVADYDALGNDWTGGSEPFDETGWLPATTGAPNGVGYDLDATYNPFIGLDVEAQMRGASTTFFTRASFNVTDSREYDALMLRVRYDDAFVANLNGLEVARSADVSASFPGYDATATSSREQTAAFDSFDLTSQLPHLRTGTNVLAIRGLNDTIASDDALVQFELEANAIYHGPIGVDDTYEVDNRAAIDFNVMTNDIPGTLPIKPTSIRIVAGPSSGSVVVNPYNGMVTYRPAAGFRGTDTFTYIVEDVSSQFYELVAANQAARWLVPDATTPATAWRNLGFDDSAWTPTTMGVGYDNSPAIADFSPYIGAGGNVGQQMFNGPTASLFVRIPFTAARTWELNSLQGTFRFDDGFVAWINGTEVTRGLLEAATVPAWNSAANSERPDSQATWQSPINLTSFRSLLREGENVLAIQVLNIAPSSDDLLMQPGLTAFTAQRLSNIATVTLNVARFSPTAVPDQVTTFERRAVDIDVLANDLPGDNGPSLDPISIRLTRAPLRGTIALNSSTGRITYTPSPFPGNVGVDYFWYTVRDTAPSGRATLVPMFAPARWLVPRGPVSDDWRGGNPEFDDGTWNSGMQGIGYGDPPAFDAAPYIGTDIRAAMHGISSSALMRIPFTVDEPTRVTDLILRMRYKHGFAAFINGVLVASSFAPSPLLWNSRATGGNPVANALMPLPFQIANPSTLLWPGTNILAIHGVNLSTGNDSFLQQAELIASVQGIGRLSNEQYVRIDIRRPRCNDMDLTGDGRIDHTDLAQLTREFGRTDLPPGSPPDFDADGAVGLTDLVALKRFFGQTCAAASPVAVALAAGLPIEPAVSQPPSRSERLSTAGVDRVLTIERRSVAPQRVSQDIVTAPATTATLRLRARGRRAAVVADVIV